ncbi:CHAT domain-containing protein [Saccharothrix variisporea]|uniref:CHAT domain-containing protein n=1 Tax=Saccharothrix variisporea TaxID=543527 RepID=A0A495XJU2_9PSEU|nr:CHAT domain-containing tetratricopeptide repeat protein [Saccharothrix variisporea]RKT74367.1 CHAT domain-containing protein [Saccharothrix variisporea]
MSAAEAKARGLHDRGRVALTVGRSAEGIRLFGQALALLGWPDTREPTWRATAARVLISMAAAEVHLGRHEAGFRLLDEAEHAVAPEDRSALRSQRGLLCILTGRLDEALRYLDEAIPLYRMPRDAYDLAADLVNRAMLHSLAGRARLAQQDLVRCEAVAQKANLPLVVAKARLNRGYCETLLGDIPAALRTFDLAKPVFEADATGLLPVLAIDKARALAQAGLADEAASELDEAIRLLSRGRPTYELAEAVLTRAQVAVAQRDPVGARMWARRAERSFLRRGDESRAAIAVLTRLRADLDSRRRLRRIAERAAVLSARLLTLGLAGDAETAALLAARACIRLKDSVKARHHLAQPRSPHPPVETRLLRSLVQAELHGAEGCTTKVFDHARAGLAKLHDHRGRLGSLDLRTGASALGVELAAIGLDTAVRQGRLPVIFDWSERSRAQAFLMRPVRPALEPAESDAVAELRQLAMVVRTAELSGHPDDQARRRCVELERQIRARGWQTDAVGDQERVVSFGDIAAELRGGEELLVSFLPGTDPLCAVAVVNGSGRLVELGDLAMITETIARLQTDLDALCGRRLPTALSTVIESSIEHHLALLSVELVEPLRELLGDRDLVVVPTGPLASVPWGMLDELRGRPITVTPSASSWFRVRQRDTQGDLIDSEPLLVAGPDLEFARAEVNRISAMLPCSAVLTGADATVEATLAAMDNRRIAHFATHGHHEPGNVLFSRLDLADGPLMAFDIAGLERPPQHVVLSSCDTGRSVMRAGDEMLGFTAAFLYGGARTVVAGVARVPDESVVDLMAAYHRLVRLGATPAKALAEASMIAPLIPLVCFGSC